MLSPPRRVGCQRQQAAREAEDIVCAASPEKRHVPAIVLDDEDTDQETGGQRCEREGDPVGYVDRHIHDGTGGEEAAERRDRLGKALTQYGRLEAPRMVAEVGLFGHAFPSARRHILARWRPSVSVSGEWMRHTVILATPAPHLAHELAYSSFFAVKIAAPNAVFSAVTEAKVSPVPPRQALDPLSDSRRETRHRP